MSLRIRPVFRRRHPEMRSKSRSLSESVDCSAPKESQMSANLAIFQILGLQIGLLVNVVTKYPRFQHTSGPCALVCGCSCLRDCQLKGPLSEFSAPTAGLFHRETKRKPQAATESVPNSMNTAYHVVSSHPQVCSHRFRPQPPSAFDFLCLSTHSNINIPKPSHPDFESMAQKQH